MSEIIALLKSGGSEGLALLTDAQLIESCTGPTSLEIATIISDAQADILIVSVELGARILSLVPSDSHATVPICNALWSLTSRFGSSYEPYRSALKEAGEKVEKAAAEAAAVLGAGGKKPAPSKGGAPPPPPPPTITIDDLLTMVPHKQCLDTCLAALSGLLSRDPSTVEIIPLLALKQLPKLLLHHSPRIQIRALVCLKLIFSIKGPAAITLLTTGAVSSLLTLLSTTSKGSVKNSVLQVLLTLSRVDPSGPHLIQLVKQGGAKALIEIILSPVSSLQLSSTLPDGQASLPTQLDMSQPIPCTPEDLQVSSAALLSYLTTNSSTACLQLFELGGVNNILALIPHNLPLPSEGHASLVPIPFYPSDQDVGEQGATFGDINDLNPLVLSKVTYPLPTGPSPPNPNVDTLQSFLLGCLSCLISSTCDLPNFISSGWSIPPSKDASEGSGPVISSPVPLLLALLEQRTPLPPPPPTPSTPSAGATKVSKASKGGAPPVAEAPPPPPPPEPFPPSIRSAALRCLSQLARLPSHTSEITSSGTFRKIILGQGRSPDEFQDLGVVESFALLLHSLLSVAEGAVETEEAVSCFKSLAKYVASVPVEYKGQGSIGAAKSGLMRAIMALPDQGEASFVAPPRPPPPSPPKSPPPPPLATSQFIWEALGRPKMTDGFELAAV